MMIAIMQPYYFPYIGYFQLIAATDLFIVYDNIKYTKKGWINRNRLLCNGKEAIFSLPLKKGHDYQNVCQRELATDFNCDKLLNQFKGAYQNAPYFSQTFPLIEMLLHYEDRNLFRFIHHSIVKICEHLRISTEIIISSEINIDHDLSCQDKVLAICDAVGASTYINTIGGNDLYSKARFKENNIDLKFIKSKSFEYKQFGDEFIPWLSIIDVMMFNPVETIQTCIKNNFELL